MAGKTRTSSAHGPTTGKKPFKHDKASKPAAAAGRSSSNNTASSLSSFKKSAPASGSSTRDDGADRKKRQREDEPDKAVVGKTSLLNAPEEIDFPRGGGSGLTQAEVREAQLEGENEAKAEADAERERDTEVIKDKGKAKRRKLERALAGASVKEKNQVPKDAIRVEHLNYKRLIPGTKVLCQIVAVRPLELILSLPSQLLAHVPITNISSEFTKRLEAAGEDSSADEDFSEDEEDDLPALRDLFEEGQWVVAAVVAAKESDSKAKLGGREGDENVRQSRRVEMSLEPEKVNEGVAKGDLKRGFILPAVVHDTEEDRGYTLSFGLSSSFTSFLPLSDASKLSPRPLEIGQVILTRITKLHANERTCSIAVEKADIAATTTDAVGSITSVLPGQLVSCLVTAVLPSAGLNVKLHGFFDGTLDAFHLPPLAPGQTYEDVYKTGQKIKARVIWDSIASTPKKFALSAAPHIVALNEERESEKRWQVGGKGRFEVRAVDDEWGLTGVVFAEGEDIGAPAFVHISRITDDHLNTIPTKSGPWRVGGAALPARVVGFSAVDGLVQLSLQPSVLEQKFLRVQDVKVGEEVKGTVKRLSDSALFISISGNVDGVVWPLHYADIRLKHPEKKFKPGQTVKARIFSADPIKNRVALTLKKALLTTERPIITTFEEARVGVVTDATVTKVLEKSVLVDFFGGVRALIPAAEAAESFTTVSDLARLFPLGKVLPVRIISVDSASQRIVASVRQVDHPSSAIAASTSSANIDDLDIGTVSSATISALHDTNLVLSLQSSAEAKGIKALLAYPTLARHRAVPVADLRSALAVGQTLDDLVVVSKNAEKGFVIVGLVPSKSAASLAKVGGAAANGSGSEKVTFDQLEEGKLYPGKVASRLPSGVVLVQFAKSNVRGRVALTELNDDFSAASDSAALFGVGAAVQAVVLSKDEDQRRVDLSLRASRVRVAQGEKEGEVKDATVASVEDLKAGQMVRGFVKNVANAGVFVELGREVTARVLIKELFDEYVKDWKPRFKVGQLVEGKVLSVDKITSQVEFSLRKGATVKKDAVSSLPGVAEAGLEKGQVVSGTVKRVQDYGAFVKIDGTSVQGLCHKSKVTDEETGSWKEHVREGQAVKAVVLDVNLETKKVSLGLKKSLFPEGALDSDEEDESDEGGDEDEDEGEDEDEEMDGEEGDSDEGEDIDLQALLNGAGADDSEEEDDDEDDEDVEMGEPEAPVASTSKLPSTSSAKSAAPLAVSSGFNWDGDEQEKDEASDEESSSDEDEAPKPTAKAAGKKAATGLASLDDRTGDLDTQAPTSVADFERLLLGSPNSSYLWIQYIAFFVGLSQLDKARELGKRALTSIHFREEQEKLNVWVALLNLENAYGDEESLEKVFRDAAQSNDAETVYLRLIDIYARSGKIEAEEELFKKTVKKFSQSPEVWTLFAQFYLSHGRPSEARELLPRSLKSLEKRDHVATISKFAQLEFKLGDAERGRTIFEGIIDSYPKRLDLWLVYVDMEIKQRNIAGVRALFDRTLAQRLSSKKGKSVFKKWLAFEKDHGDDAGVEQVKQKAVAFVQGRQQGDDEDEE
ncbi:hypothetical protein JCM6882_000408 [Rhodosporidiobolus microsporus]